MVLLILYILYQALKMILNNKRKIKDLFKYKFRRSLIHTRGSSCISVGNFFASPLLFRGDFKSDHDLFLSSGHGINCNRVFEVATLCRESHLTIAIKIRSPSGEQLVDPLDDRGRLVPFPSGKRRRIGVVLSTGIGE